MAFTIHERLCSVLLSSSLTENSRVVGPEDKYIGLSWRRYNQYFMTFAAKKPPMNDISLFAEQVKQKLNFRESYLTENISVIEWNCIIDCGLGEKT